MFCSVRSVVGSEHSEQMFGMFGMFGGTGEPVRSGCRITREVNVNEQASRAEWSVGCHDRRRNRFIEIDGAGYA